MTDSTGHVTDSTNHVTDSTGHVTDSANHVTDSTGHVTDSTGHVIIDNIMYSPQKENDGVMSVEIIFIGYYDKITKIE